MKKNILLILFAGTILLGFFLRFYKLGLAPAGLYLDEAGQGYSAYSILKTGKDEFGMPFPAAFRSFNDFKTPIYIYLIVPFIPIFGLNTFTIRFPSFFFSILTLPLLYFLIKKLSSHQSPNTSHLALIASLMLAISPWHVLFGRTNFECNVALFFLLLGYYLFQLSLKKPVMLVLSAFFLAIALPAYHSERILVPLIILFFVIKYFKILTSPSHLKYSIIGLVIGIVITIPTIEIFNTPGFMARVSTLNIFGANSWGVKEWPSLYLSYFSPRNLFWLGDSGPRSSFPGLSVMYLWQFPLFVYGIYLLFTKKIASDLKQFIILMLVISPIPASLTRDPFSTIRSLPLVIPLNIICALAIADLFERVKNKKLFIVGSSLTLAYSLLKLYSSGYLLNEYYRAQYWDYGWEQVANVIKNELDQDLPIVVDNARNEPYSQLLVFLKHDPIQYQKDNFEVSNQDYYSYMGRNTTKKIGRIVTNGIDWKNETERYFIGDYLSISHDQIRNNKLLLIKEIYYPDGSPAYRIVKTQPELYRL